MAKFKIKAVKQMDPRPGKKYATEYYQQSQRDYDETFKFMLDKMQQLLDAQDRCYPNENVLDQPLRGFPRTSNRPNYSATDIMMDLVSQYRAGKDWPSGMVGRWNRLFEDYPEWQLEFVEHIDANNFNTLFTNQ